MAVKPQVREQNPSRIFRLLRTGEELTRQEIAAKLLLSMPTTLQNVTELVETGLLEECGAIESTGGRRAKKVRLCRQAGLAVGIDVALRHVELVVTDLLGNVLHSKQVPLAFQNKADWYQQLSGALADFLRESGITESKVLGAGVSFPGIIDAQSGRIVRSHILNLEDVSLARFQKSIPFPAVFANDANCACYAEKANGHDSFVYVSLNSTVGGAIMLEQNLWLGDTCQAGEIGHMLLIPGGRPCYCGKAGCADAYLSSDVLAGPDRTLAEFFEGLRAGGPAEQAVWDSYLEHLAVLLTNLRMLTNMDMVIGGSVGAFIAPYLDDLCAQAAKYDRFARDVDYIFSCAQREHACAAGAAALALEQFAGRVLERTERTEQ